MGGNTTADCKFYPSFGSGSIAIHGENPLPRPQLPKDRGAARLDQDFQAGHSAIGDLTGKLVEIDVE